jgi:two-component system, NtrC family, nitrogen regulation sensor histidine kinase GlnL
MIPPHPAALIESFTTPVLVVDRDGFIHYGNPAAGEFWRVSPERLREFTLWKLFGIDSPLSVNLQRAFTEEVSSTVDAYRFDQGEGLPPLFLHIQLDPVLVPDQAVQLALLSFWDQTTREQLAAQEQKQRVMESIGLMMQRLAHELQNPLSGVKGATQLLARKIREIPELSEYASVMLRELERMERLVRGLLSQGGEPPLTKTVFNVHELLDSLIWFQQNAREHLSFRREYDPSLPDLVGDRDRLHQVFLNLLQNAAEASPRDGAITVRTKMIGPWQEREPHQMPPGTYFLIEIEDQGPGVPREHVGRLFTPFLTTKRTGHGLGLSISYQIVRAHSGQIRYRTAANGGAVFSVLLPLEPA